jgi:hypothetical protein
METTRKLSDIDPNDLSVVERLFGQRLAPNGDAVLVLRVPDDFAATENDNHDELPSWCNVLEGMSDKERDEFRSALESTPVTLARPE